jgi:hypothetical protein
MSRTALAMAAAAALTTFIQPAFAESRLFSARADKEGVTVDQALLNGQGLTVAGKGGGATFFRIDNPAGQIDCHQHFTFVASTGERQESDVDLCAQNWQVSLHLTSTRQMVVEAAPAAAPPAADTGQAPAADAAQPPAADNGQPPAIDNGQPAAAEPPAAPAAQPPAVGAQGPASGVITGSTQMVTITTDDPAIGIDEVFIEKESIEIQSKQGNSVEVAIGGGPGQIPCQRDLGLKLSDGRTIARQVNICDHNWSVLVMLGGGEAPAAEATPPATPPASPPQAPVANVAPAEPAPPPGPAPAQGEAWSFAPGAGTVTVTYGVPRSERGDFTASCRLGGRDITVGILRPMPGGQVGEPLPITLGAGALARTYRTVPSPIVNVAVGSHPQFKTTPADALWQALIHEKVLVVQVGQAPPFSIPLQGSGQAIKPFLAACAGAPPPPPVAAGSPPPPPPPGAGGSPPVVAGGPSAPPGPPPGGALPYQCNDGSTLTIRWDIRQHTALVAEPGSQPILLYRGPAGHPDVARYNAGPAFLLGHEETLRWSRAGEPPRVCRPRLPYPVAAAPQPPGPPAQPQ